MKAPGPICSPSLAAAKKTQFSGTRSPSSSIPKLLFFFPREGGEKAQQETTSALLPPSTPFFLSLSLSLSPALPMISGSNYVFLPPFPPSPSVSAAAAAVRNGLISPTVTGFSPPPQEVSLFLQSPRPAELLSLPRL